jgi:UDP-glucose 4-epimerase
MKIGTNIENLIRAARATIFGMKENKRMVELSKREPITPFSHSEPCMDSNLTRFLGDKEGIK